MKKSIINKHRVVRSLVFAACFLVAYLSVNLAIAQNQKSLLWEISGNGLTTSSYLFGTIHLICPEDLSITEAMKTALGNTEQLILELDMDDPQFAASMQQMAVNEGGRNLSSLLEEDELAVLNNYFTKHYGAGMEHLGTFKPLTLTSLMFIKSIDCPQPGSYEQSVIAVAHNQQKQVLGLETIEEQMAIFDKVDEKEQLSWVVKNASDEAKMKQNVDELIAAYKSQDPALVADQMKNYPEYQVIEKELLEDRNRKWIGTMSEQMLSKPTFFAVGAAHLGTEVGVIALLRKAGFTVSPVNNDI